MYIPEKIILKKYADVLTKFALGDGGIKPGEIVYIEISEVAKPLLLALQQSILECGAHYVINYIPDGTKRILFEHGNDEQIGFFPKDYMLSLIDTCDHFLTIISETDKSELDGINPEKIMLRQKDLGFYHSAKNKKADAGKLTWTIAMYGTDAMAQYAGLTIEEYWNEIINACYLNKENPVSEWANTFSKIKEIKTKLNDLEIEYIHVGGEHSDLTLKIGADRLWEGGTGKNIPTFEIFTSPNCNFTNGWIEFNQPLVAYGNIVSDIRLEFKDGIIVNSSAKIGNELLQNLINMEGGNKLGEFSLTDKKFSNITKFMGTTLFDENIGGMYGNTHVAIGSSFPFTYKNYTKDTKKSELTEKGFNLSNIHNDIISTYDRIVTAYFKDGTSKIIYRNGEFEL